MFTRQFKNNDFQKFLGHINWLCHSLGVPNDALTILFKTVEP